MSDKAIENAKIAKKQLVERRIFLNRQVVEIDRLIANIDRFIDNWETFAAVDPERTVQDLLALTENEPEPTDTFQKKTTGNSSKEEVAEVALEVIRERGEPVMRADLYKELISRGLIIQGKDPEMVLSTMLWRMRDKIVRFKKGGYWDASKPIGNYDPVQERAKAEAKRQEKEEHAAEIRSLSEQIDIDI